MTTGPKVTSVTPDRGPIAGGTSITIAGENFTGAASVTFEGTPAASFAVIDDNTITAVTPATLFIGPAYVVVTDTAGITSYIYPLDSSGNGLDGVYSFVNDGIDAQLVPGSYPNFVPGLVSGNDAMQTADPLLTMLAAGGGVPQAALDLNVDLTVEFWAQLSDDHTSIGGVVECFSGAGLIGAVFAGVDGSDGSIGWARGDAPSNGQQYDFDASGYITDGLPHYVVVTAVEGAARCWVDNVELTGTPVVSDNFSNGTMSGPWSVRINSTFAGDGLNGTLDELAFYSSVLDSTQTAAHFAAASVSAFDYAAAVLGDSPTGYYRFDDGRGNGLFQYATQGWLVGRVGVGI